MLIRTTRQLREVQVGSRIKFEKPIMCFVRGEQCYECVEGEVSHIGTRITIVSQFGNLYELPIPKSA